MHVINDPITSLSPHDGYVVTTKKTYTDVDVIILATGYKVTNCAPNFSVVGRDETTNLSESWEGGSLPMTLNGVVSPGFPNFFIQYGPGTNTILGSITFFSECAANFITSLVTLATVKGGGVVEVKRQACIKYVEDVMSSFVDRPEMDTCSSWYKPKAEDNVGVVKKAVGWSVPVTNYPGGMIGYWLRTKFWKKSDFVLGGKAD